MGNWWWTSGFKQTPEACKHNHIPRYSHYLPPLIIMNIHYISILVGYTFILVGFLWQPQIGLFTIFFILHLSESIKWSFWGIYPIFRHTHIQFSHVFPTESTHFFPAPLLWHHWAADSHRRVGCKDFRWRGDTWHHWLCRPKMGWSHRQGCQKWQLRKSYHFHGWTQNMCKTINPRFYERFMEWDSEKS